MYDARLLKLSRNRSVTCCYIRYIRAILRMMNQQIITSEQWSNTDQAELVTRTEIVRDYFDLLVLHLSKSTELLYPTMAQSNCLKSLKENLPENESIVLRDSVENYTFLVQDEIQGMYWNKQQCSLRLVFIYHRKSNQTKSHFLCFISDYLMHDVDFVYIVIKETVAFVKNFILGNLFKVHYFFHGCSGQMQESGKNFLNLCYHERFFMFFVCRLSLQQAVKCPRVLTELVFNLQ